MKKLADSGMAQLGLPTVDRHLHEFSAPIISAGLSLVKVRLAGALVGQFERHPKGCEFVAESK
jgi:hypothetical protein